MSEALEGSAVAGRGPVAAGRRAPAGARRGMTLLELLFVMTLISLVLGIGLGLFAGIDPGRRAAVGLVQNVLRRGRQAALQRGAPARVRFELAEGVMVAEAQRVVGTWRFDGDQPFAGAFDLDGRPLEGGRIDDDGYVGKGVSFVGEPYDARLEFPVQHDPAWGFRRGFVFELRVRFAELSDGRLLVVGDCFRADVSRSGEVGAYFVPALFNSQGVLEAGDRRNIKTGLGALRAGEWARLRFTYDMRRFTITVDGVEVASEAYEDMVWNVESPMILAGDARPIQAVVDDIVVMAVDAEERVHLPAKVVFAPTSPKEVVFGPGGVLDPEVHPEPVEVEITYVDGTGAKVRVGRYGTVE